MRIWIIMTLLIMMSGMVSADNIKNHNTGTSVSGHLQNTFDTNGYTYDVTGSPNVFTTHPITADTNFVYLGIWMWSNDNDLTLQLRNQVLEQWDDIGVVSSTNKRGASHFLIDKRDYLNPDNAIRFRLSGTNLTFELDKFEVSERLGGKNKIDEVGTCLEVESVKAVNEVTMEVFGTEYVYPDEAKIWLQLVNENGTGVIEDATCFAHVYTPDNFYYLERVSMTYFHDGIYYYDLATAPIIQGVYPVIAECYFSASQVREYSNSTTLITYQTEGGDYTDTHIDDGTTHTIQEQKVVGNPASLEFIYNFNGTGSRCWETYGENDLTGVTVSWNGVWNSITGDDLRFSIYNWSGATWLELANTVESNGGEQTVSNSYVFNNSVDYGLSDNVTGNVMIKITDTPATPDTTKTNLNTDYFFIACDALTEANWQYKRGTNEMHVRSEYNYYSEGEHGIGNNENNLANATDINEQGGVVTITKTISSGVYEDVVDTPVHVHSPNGFTCEDIFYVEYFNSSDPTQRFFNVSNSDWHWHDEFNHCDVYWDWNLTKGGIYQFDMVMTNVWMQDLEIKLADADNHYDFVYGMCLFYQLYNGFDNYTQILTARINSTDNFYKTCGYYINAYWRFNMSAHNAEQSILEVTNELELEAVLSEMKETEFLSDTLHQLGESLYEQITMVADFSEVAQNSPLSPNQAVFWSQQAQSNINYDLILLGNALGTNATPEQIWSYSMRNLTNASDIKYDIIDTNELANATWENPSRELTNASNVAGDFWNYDGTLSENIIVQIAERVWNYVGRFIHGEII